MDALIVVVVVVVLLVVVLGLAAMSMYNGFVRSRNLIQESWRQVDVELNRRYELIPNLVETVRAFAAHERNTLEDVTRLRNQARSVASHDSGLPTQQRSQVEEQLSGAVRNLVVSVEAYPDLKSDANFLELQKQLAETEDRIAAGRRFYNANVRVYNTRIDSVPSNVIAGLAKFEKATYFEVQDPAVRRAPDVSFGEIAYRGEQPPASAPSAPQVGTGSGQGHDALPDPNQQWAPQQQPQQEWPQQPGGYQPPSTGQPGQQPPAQGGNTPPQSR